MIRTKTGMLVEKDEEKTADESIDDDDAAAFNFYVLVGIAKNIRDHLFGSCRNLDEPLQRRFCMGWIWKRIQFSSCFHDFWSCFSLWKWCSG